MKRKNKNGFTLVELLAVIVILAIILVIAVPKIMDVIKDTTKASLESSAKMVAAQVENQYTVAQTLGKEFGETGSCMQEWAGLNDVDYASCTYEVTTDGTAKVTIKGQGKFKGLYACNATRSSSTVTEESCSVCKDEELILKIANPTKPYVVGDYDSCVSYLSSELPNYDVSQDIIEQMVPTLCNGDTVFEMSFSENIEQFIVMGLAEVELIENNVIEGTIEEETVCVPYGQAVTYINNLYNDTNVRSKFGLTKDNTNNQNIRYVGSNGVVKNYVQFGNTGELWRIIGVFEVETAEGDTEELVKIVRDEPFKDSEGNALWMSWDSSAETINSGNGINEWSQSDLKEMLNTYYIGNGTTCTYCNGENQATCSNSCNSIVTPINSTYTSMIESVIWNTGAIEWNDDGITPIEAYNAERGSTTGKICSSTKDDGSANNRCNDTVTRKTEWEGKIGLIYPSDWGYASTDPDCTDITDDYGTCYQSNWLFDYSWYWTLSPHAHSGNADNVWGVDSHYAVSDDTSSTGGVRAALYLKSDVQIIDGDGSKNNPYKLELNSGQ